MKKIIAINASPRTGWNTATLILPVLFIMTSNASEEFYDKIGYDKMVSGYQNTLSGMVGPTKIMICGDTL